VSRGAPIDREAGAAAEARARSVCRVLSCAFPVAVAGIVAQQGWSAFASPFLLGFCALVAGLAGLGFARARRVTAAAGVTGSAWRARLVFSAAATLPGFVLVVLVWHSPIVPPRLLKILLLSSLLPLLATSIWSLVPTRLHRAASVRSVVALIAYQSLLFVAGAAVVERVMEPPIEGTPSLNSADLSYWYYRPNTATTVNGIDLRFNSLGFRGPEPDPPREGVVTVLVLGDSVPFGGDQPEAKTFPRRAEALVNEALGGTPEVRVLNAALPGFSTVQIKNFYLGRLGAVPHDVVVLCFYVDDVNRELRYRKNDIVYTPSWPEWIQDVYYASYSGYMFLTLLGFHDTTFLLHRSRSLEEAWPGALDALEAIREESARRGAQLAVFNIPTFYWFDQLSDERRYRHLDRNRELETWASRRGVAYWDTLPGLLHVDMDALRNGPSDLHFNEAGHELMADQLARFLTPLARPTG